MKGVMMKVTKTVVNNPTESGNIKKDIPFMEKGTGKMKKDIPFTEKALARRKKEMA